MYNQEECLDLLEKVLQKQRDDEISCTATTYLDHAGTPLPTKTLLSAVFEELKTTSFANPHSIGGKQSSFTANILAEARMKTLNHCGLQDDKEYTVIFTAGATAAIKLVGETFPWSEFSEFWFPPNAHTSLLGLRGFVQDANTRCVCDDAFFPALPLSVEREHGDVYNESIENLETAKIFKTSAQSIGYVKMISRAQDTSKPPSKTLHLVAFPGECNMSGAKLQFSAFASFMESINGVSSSQRFLWLLDAAKLAGSSEMNLSILRPEQRPHFITLSFYKIFGYPTGLGALVVRRDVLNFLQKRYFGGGTLLAGAVDTAFQVSKPNSSHDHYEDGTPNFHGIAAIRHGFDFINALGGLDVISRYTHHLRCSLEEKMRSLCHYGDPSKPLCRIYNKASHNAIEFQGAVIAFNLQYSNGCPVSFHEVGKVATANNIQLRTGCFCNIGGCQILLNISGKDAMTNYQLGRICSADFNEVDIINNKNTGLCRISLGFGSTMKDCAIFIEFLQREFLNRIPTTIPLQHLLPPHWTKKNRDLHEHLNDISTDEAALEEEEKDLYWHQEVYKYPLAPTASQQERSQMVDYLKAEKPSVKVAALFVYPIKSCSGVRVDDWPVTHDGLLYDRYFAIADERGKIINQKQYPEMALIQPSFVYRETFGNPAGNTSEFTECSSIKQQGLHRLGQLILRIACTNPIVETVLEVPLSSFVMPMDSESSSSMMDVDEEFHVCGRKTIGKKVSRDADEWITQFFFLTSLLKSDQTTSGLMLDDIDVSVDRSLSQDQLGQGERKSDQFQKRIEIKRKKFFLVRSTMSSLLPNTDATNDAAATENLRVGKSAQSPKKDDSSDVKVKNFANTAQYLLLSIPSVKTLIEMMKETHDGDGETISAVNNIKIENFRPNIIVTKDPTSCHILNHPHMEDGWKNINVLLNGSSKTNESLGLNLSVTGPCSRCSMVNVNGQSGIMDCRVFDALKNYRKEGANVYFGQFLSFESLFRLEKAVDGSNMNLEKSDGGDLNTNTWTICVGDIWFVNE